jgi:hypothetical protein
MRGITDKAVAGVAGPLLLGALLTALALPATAQDCDEVRFAPGAASGVITGSALPPWLGRLRGNTGPAFRKPHRQFPVGGFRQIP